MENVLYFFCSLVVFSNGFFIHFRWSIGARPFRIPIPKLCTSQESATLDIHFFTLYNTFFGGSKIHGDERKREERERERG